jgi:hypothetical protein
MSNQSIIEHRANMYYVHLREDYLLVCMSCQYRKVNKKGEQGKASPYCKALILAVLENWTNTKRDQGLNLEVSMTHQQWNDAMYGMFGRNVIIDSLDELVGEGLIEREAFKTARGGKDQYKYLLNFQEVNRRMKVLEERSPSQMEPTPGATFTSKPSTDEEQRLQVNGQSGKVNVATFTNEPSRFTCKPSSSSPTSKSKPFIDYTDSNIDSHIDSTQITEAANAAALSLLSLAETLSLEELDLVLQKLQEQKQQFSSSEEPPSPSDETAASSSVQGTSPSSSVQKQQQASEEKGGKGRQGQKTPRKGSKDVALTLQGQHILELYDGFKGRKVARSPETIRAANGLGDVVSSDEDFESVLKAIASDPFLKQKQVRIDLDFVYRKYDGFLDIVDRARGKPIPGAANGKTDYNEVAGMTDEQRSEYKRRQKEKHKKALPPGMDHETFMKLPPDERIAVLKKMREQQSVAV